MFKLVTLIKRRPGLTVDAFRAYYEDHHAKIGRKYLAGYAERYVRRYVDPLDGAEADFAYDVVMEIWFRDRQAFEAAMKRIAEPVAQMEIIADEEKLFDRASIVSFTVSECETDLGAAESAS